MNEQAWDALKSLSVDPTITSRRPNIGTRVRVVEGRLMGAQGRVTWHGRDQFSKAYRYADSFQSHMMDMMGQHGFRVRVQPEDDEPFFIAADKVCAL